MRRPATTASRRPLARGLILTTLLVLSGALPASTSLFERIGGAAKLHAVVEQFTVLIVADERINFAFADTDLTKFKQLLYEQLCALAGGPCTYSGRDMRTAHAKLNINNAQFNALAEDLYAAFDHEHVPYRVQNQVMALLAPMEKDIVKPGLAPGTQAPPARLR
jgi:hemoglobin